MECVVAANLTGSIYTDFPGGLITSLRPWQLMHFSFSGIAAETVEAERMKTVTNVPIIRVYACMASTPSPNVRFFEVATADGSNASLYFVTPIFNLTTWTQ
jgi:hypothetical protein